MRYYSIHFNNTNFLILQKHYINNLFVINNHSNPDIEKTCIKFNIPYSNLQNPFISDGSKSHGYALNYLRNIIDYTDNFCILDHDFFPHKEISLDNYDIIGLKQFNKINQPYLWPGFLAINKNININHIDFMPNSNLGDTGFETYKLCERSDLNIKFCKEKYIGHIGESVQNSIVISKFDNYGIHFINGSNWFNVPNHIIDKKYKILIKELNKSIK